MPIPPLGAATMVDRGPHEAAGLASRPTKLGIEKPQSPQSKINNGYVALAFRGLWDKMQTSEIAQKTVDAGAALSNLGGAADQNGTPGESLQAKALKAGGRFAQGQQDAAFDLGKELGLGAVDGIIGCLENIDAHNLATALKAAKDAKDNKELFDAMKDEINAMFNTSLTTVVDSKDAGSVGPNGLNRYVDAKFAYNLDPVAKTFKGVVTGIIPTIVEADGSYPNATGTVQTGGAKFNGSYRTDNGGSYEIGSVRVFAS